MHTILHVIPSLASGGIVTQVLQLAANLPRGNFEQRVVALDHDRESASDFRALGIDAISLGQRSTLDPIAFWRFKRLISQQRPQIIHAWSAEAQRIAALANVLGGSSKLVGSERKIRPTAGGRFSPLNRWFADRTTL